MSLELTITNTSDRALTFEPGASGLHARFYPDDPLVELLLPEGAGSSGEVGFPDLLHGNGVPAPSLFQRQPLAPHASVTGWAAVVAPLRAAELIVRRPADLELFCTDGDAHYVGQIRMWK